MPLCFNMVLWEAIRYFAYILCFLPLEVFTKGQTTHILDFQFVPLGAYRILQPSSFTPKSTPRLYLQEGHISSLPMGFSLEIGSYYVHRYHRYSLKLDVY